MSFTARSNLSGDDHRSRFSIYEDEIADNNEDHQSTRSELPAEIPDSQPDPYLPAEIPDSQPDVVYHEDLPFGDPDYSEVSSQLPPRVSGELHLGDASAFNSSDDEKEVVNPDPDDREATDSRVNRFDRFRRAEVHHSVLEEVLIPSSSRDTEIVPGGTRLTERLNNRIVSLSHHLSDTNHPASQLTSIILATISVVSCHVSRLLPSICVRVSETC